MNNKYEQINDYDQQMIEAYINKPEVTAWYVNAFKRFSINGVDVMKWNWSWWAFFGNVFYLLYRKAYLPAGILFALNMLVGFIPFGGLILWILAGGYSPYFVYKTYKQKKIEVERAIDKEDESKRFETMQLVGGTNDWAIWVGVILSVFFWGIIFSTMGFVLAFIGLVVATK